MNELSGLGISATNKAVLEYLEDAIINGKLRKGDRLPTERSLAETLGVSRTSVREAIKALETMGVINSIQGSGNYINSAPEMSIDRAVCALFSLNDGTFENILQLRIMIEAEACREAARGASQEELEELARLADYDYEDPSLEVTTAHDRAFHFAIVSLSRNTLIKYLYNTLMSLMDLYRRQVLQATADKRENYITRQGHMEILSALQTRDASAAEQALRAHLSLSEDYRHILSLSSSDARRENGR